MNLNHFAQAIRNIASLVEIKTFQKTNSTFFLHIVNEEFIDCKAFYLEFLMNKTFI